MDTPYYIKTTRSIGIGHPDIGIIKHTVARSGHDDMCDCDEHWKAQKIVEALNAFEREGR